MPSKHEDETSKDIEKNAHLYLFYSAMCAFFMFAVFLIFGISTGVSRNLAILIFMGFIGYFIYIYLQLLEKEKNESIAKIELIKEQAEEDRAINQIMTPLNILKSETSKNKKTINYLEQQIIENKNLINFLEIETSELTIETKNYLMKANAIIEKIEDTIG